MSQLNSMLELHKRVLGDLDRRDAAVAEQEKDARRVLEQALAQCAADRAVIAQERTVLVQAQQVYRRFLETDNLMAAVGGVQPAPREPELSQGAVRVELVESVAAVAELANAEPMQPAKETLELEGFEAGSDFENRIRDLRNDLCNQIIAGDGKPEPKASKWAGPLRGLLATGT